MTCAVNRIGSATELSFALECAVAMTPDLWRAVGTVSHLISFVAPLVSESGDVFKGTL